VRRVDTSGRITNIAGTGEPGFSGDDGPATDAQLNQPHSIELDSRGALYIADIGNHRVRRVGLFTSIIETVAGTGERAPTPDGAPFEGTPLNGPRAFAFAPPTSLYLALREGNAVFRLDLEAETIHHVAGTGARGNSGDGGPAKEAKFFGPKGIAVGPEGDIFLADTENHTIRRIAPDGTITTVAGTGVVGDGPDGDPLGCALARPHGVFAAADGRVCIGDSENHRVRVLE
jgi:sugar lactone lactonase YvrE